MTVPVPHFSWYFAHRMSDEVSPLTVDRLRSLRSVGCFAPTHLLYAEYDLNFEARFLQDCPSGKYPCCVLRVETQAFFNRVDEICLSFFCRCVFRYCSVDALDSRGVSACLIMSSDTESSTLPDI